MAALVLVTCAKQKKVSLPDAPTGRALEVGSPAPDFSLVSSEAETWTLSELEGGPVVIYFYPKNETPGCTAQACSFRDNHEAFEELGVTLLGISLDSEESHQKFKASHRLNFPLLSDPDGIVHSLYGAWKEESTWLSPMSVDRSTFVVDSDGVIRKIWRKVDVVGHADEVLEFVRNELV